MATNLEHESVIASNDADGLPRLRESLNSISFFLKIVVCLAYTNKVCHIHSRHGHQGDMRITAAYCFIISLTLTIA